MSVNREFERSRGREVSGDLRSPADGDVCNPLKRQDAADTVEAHERELRRKIQAHRIKRLGWSEYVFHYVMEGLGFGRSLTALGQEDLSRLWEIIRGYRRHGRPAEYNYDRQGRYMHAMMKRAVLNRFLFKLSIEMPPLRESLKSLKVAGDVVRHEEPVHPVADVDHAVGELFLWL